MMIRPTVYSAVRFNWRPPGLLGARRVLGAACCAALLACKSAGDTPSAERGAPTTEPERFSFVLPSGYVRTELRGEGSESLRVPPGARVARAGERFEVTSGSDFALDLRSDAPPLSDLEAGVAPVLREPDLLIFRSGAGYSFVVVRELVPEWDETERQRVACGSAGGTVSSGATRADARGFSKSAVENMVAACRSLELPKLE